MRARGGTVHSELKRQAHKILIERGFNDDEIEYECPVKIGIKEYIVDVVGLRNGKLHTAIECGGVQNKDKLTHLSALFEVVEHIPYIDESIVTKINEYENLIELQKRRISELDHEIKILRIPVSLPNSARDHEPQGPVGVEELSQKKKTATPRRRPPQRAGKSGSGSPGTHNPDREDAQGVRSMDKREVTPAPEPGKPCEGCRYYKDYQNAMGEIVDISKGFRRILHKDTSPTKGQ